MFSVFIVVYIYKGLRRKWLPSDGVWWSSVVVMGWYYMVPLGIDCGDWMG